MGPFGAYAFGVVPFGAVAEADDYSTETAFAQLLADPDAERIYLVEIGAWDPSAGAETTLRYSTSGFITDAGDTPASTLYEARVRSALRFRRSMFPDDADAAEFTPDEIVLANGDGGLDGILDHAFDGREIRVLLGGEGFGYTDFGEIFVGTGAGGARWSTAEIRIPVRDFSALLDVPLQPELYEGTGGDEGGEEVEGQPKPLGFGVVRNATPALLNAATPTFQLHAGEIESVDAGYDSGSALTKVPSSPGVGEFSADLAAGTVTLGGSPDGAVTFDFKGSKTGGDYVNTTAAILQRIAEDQAGLASGRIDLASFASFAARQAAVVGYFSRDAQSCADALRALVAGVGGWWGFSRTGALQIGLFRGPGTSQRTFTESEILSIERIDTPLPSWRRRVGWGHNWTVQSAGELAPAVAADRAAFVAQAQRVVSSSDSAVKTRHILARDPEPVPAFFDARADAEAEAARARGLYSPDRDIYAVRVGTQPFALDINRTITLQHSRLGLSAGRRFVILELAEDAASAEIDMLVWG